MPLLFVLLVVLRLAVLSRMPEKAQAEPQLPVHRADPIRPEHASLQSLLFLDRVVLLPPIRPTTRAGGLTGSENRFVVSPPKRKKGTVFNKLHCVRSSRIVNGNHRVEKFLIYESHEIT